MAQCSSANHQRTRRSLSRFQPLPYVQEGSDALHDPASIDQIGNRRRGLDPTVREYVPESSRLDAGTPSHLQMLARAHNSTKNATKSRTNSISADSVQTVLSINTDPLFWSPNPRALNPKARSWKSQSTKLNNDWQRIKKLVAHIAPEQFRSPAKPTIGPCEVMPTSYQEYLEHLRDIRHMAAEQVEKNIAGMRGQIKMLKSQGRVATVFGKGRKEFHAGFSPVLCRPTIFSDEYEKLHLPRAKWPQQSELQFDSDPRQQHMIRSRRFLPPPRMPIVSNVPSFAQPLMPILPLDQTGPVFACGPTPAVVAAANKEMDQDETFEQIASLWIGEELMNECGPRTEPFIPDWLESITEFH